MAATWHLLIIRGFYHHAYNFVRDTAGVTWAVAPRVDYHADWEGYSYNVRSIRPVDPETNESLGGVGYT
tara:strand:- start:4612 stop:4818 length:207 start_codon:yes stop_codon:yes gene_type:complete